MTRGASASAYAQEICIRVYIEHQRELSTLNPTPYTYTTLNPTPYTYTTLNPIPCAYTRGGSAIACAKTVCICACIEVYRGTCICAYIEVQRELSTLNPTPYTYTRGASAIACQQARQRCTSRGGVWGD